VIYRHFCIVVNRELRQDTSDGGSTKHIEVCTSCNVCCKYYHSLRCFSFQLELKDTSITYETADNLGILPDNEKSVVEKVCELQGYDKGMWFTMDPLDVDGKLLIPTPCSVEEALTRHCELIGVPLRKATVSYFAFYATDEEEKKELAHLVSKEGKDVFHAKIVDDVLNIVELLEHYPSIKVPFGAFMEICPRMQPRMYTISSSPEVVGSTVHVTASVVNQPKPRNRVHRGVTTTYLTNLSTEKGSKVRVFVRPSTFRLPKDRSTPITMVGPGTGIAPMRALLQLRKHQGNETGAVLVPTIMSICILR
jgi:NADPH-ferrihemoprotein reductase